MRQIPSNFTIIKSITIILVYISRLKKNFSYYYYFFCSHIHSFCVSRLKKNLLVSLCSLIHTLIISLKGGNTLLPPFYYFFIPCTTLSWLSSFSLNGSLLVALLILLCSFLFLYFLFNMRHLFLLMQHTLVANIYLL